MPMSFSPIAVPTIHVVDDDANLRCALATLLQSAGQSVAVYSDPAEFLARSKPDDPGCLLLDIRFPDADGLDFQARLNAQPVAMPVILMSGHADVLTSVRGMKAGAVDFLSKPFEDEALLNAVSVALGRDEMRRRIEREAREVRARYDTLTSRETEVMVRVVAGLFNKQIAGELRLSEVTVKHHRGTMMRKMQVRTVPDLVRLCALAPVRALSDA